MLAKSKLNSIEVLISKTLIDSNIGVDEFVLINNVLFDDIKEETKDHNDLKKCKLHKYHLIVWSVEKNTLSKNPKVVKTQNGKIILLVKCAVCNIKKSTLLKEQKLDDY